MDFACKDIKLEDVIKCGLGLSKADLKVLQTLLRYQDWIPSQKISNKNNMSISAVQRSLKILLNQKLVERRQQNLEGSGYQFIYKALTKKQITEQIEQNIDAWSTKVKKTVLTQWCSKEG